MQPVKLTTHTLQRLVVARFRIILILIALFCGSAFLCNLYHTRRGPKPVSPLSQRAFAMCRAMTGSCDGVTAPRLYDETLALPGIAQANRRLWSVICSSDGQRINLLFNEKTGRLCCAFGESRSPAETPPRRAAGIATPAQALRVARLRLKQLEMIAPDARYTLEEAPLLTREDTAWEIQWQVKHTGDPTPRRLKIVLDREAGLPLHISDLYELQQFASR